jgi:hypothetical protein
MKNILINSWSAWLLLATLVAFSSCQKDKISPQNQSTAFVKYYGHVATQTSSDLLRTPDGGYIMLGSTNSYNTGDEHDIFVVKTDSLGNEQWSSSFGKLDSDGDVGTAFEGDYVRYDEVGVRLAELPDGSAYAVACNRTYVTYADASSTVGRRGETKIVMYQIDAATGAPTSQDGVELNSSTADTVTEVVSDMKIDTSSGIIKYILTGMTTGVSVKATVGNNNNEVSDRSDIYTVLLDENFDILWTQGNRAYGRIGKDYGVSVQILPQGYLVCGTIESNYDPNNNNFVPYSDMLTVIMTKDQGLPIGPTYYGEEGYDYLGGHSVYDASSGLITILGHVTDGPNEGSLAIVQVDESGARQQGITFYDVGGIATADNPLISASIDLIPNGGGFIISATHEVGLVENNIYIMKVDEQLSDAEGWTYFFGYDDQSASAIFATKDIAGTVMPVTELVSGTSQSVLTGYAFTGTFGLGTNEMMGLVKLNPEGTFTP